MQINWLNDGVLSSSEKSEPKKEVRLSKQIRPIVKNIIRIMDILMCNNTYYPLHVHTYMYACIPVHTHTYIIRDNCLKHCQTDLVPVLGLH